MTSERTNYFETLVTSSTISSSAFVPSYEIRMKLYDLLRTSPPTHFKAIKSAYAAFKSFLNENLYIYNDQDIKQKVECITAKQERAIAKLNQEKNLILPIVSLSLNEIDLYNEKQKYGPLVVHEKYWDDEKKMAYRVIREVGKSVNLSMDLYLWSKYMTDLVELSELVEFFFRPNLCLQTTQANNTKFFLDGSSDISETTVSDGDNRLLRKVYSIRCETYIYGKQFRITNTGEIEEFNVEWEIEQ